MEGRGWDWGKEEEGLTGKKWLGGVRQVAAAGKAATDRGGGNGKEQRRDFPAEDWRADSMWGGSGLPSSRRGGGSVSAFTKPTSRPQSNAFRFCMTRAPCNERGSAAFPTERASGP